ncbi:MAG: hypothetical protein H6737_15270 [Alphaproteobacteria bacterium]|nr:hypothetical protein [Alphaproteobacteria bacterium]
MNRSIALVAAVLVGGALLATSASAGDEEKKTQLASKCYPMERILVSAGTDDTKIAGAAQQLLNKMRSEGLSEFIVLEAGGQKVLCGSPDAD